MPKSLLFLPDISGFTDFVSQTEITHSQHIIAELLEVLIEANDLDLELAEIEGDALFFYKEGVIPSYPDLKKQVDHMFLAFHNHLKLYDHQRICECGACQSAAKLQLKFFAHAGEIQFVELKDFKKPHGKEVIVVHRLMKNSVPIHEYLLISHALNDEFEGPDALSESAPVEQGVEEYDAGQIHFHYANLEGLLSKLNELPKYTGPSDSVDPILIKGKVKVNATDLMEIVSNLKYRHHWSDGVDKILYRENRINRAGTEHTCIINGKEVVLETVTKPSQDNKFIYGEKTKNFPLMKEFTNYFVIEENGADSELTIEGHLSAKNLLGTLAKPLFKRKIKSNYQKIFDQLKTFAEGTELITKKAV